MNITNIEDLNLPEVNFSKGDTLLEEGVASSTLYILQSGEVSITASGEQLCTCDVKGTVFGESSVLLGSKTSAKVSVSKDASFLVIEDAASFLKTQPELIFGIAQILAERINHMNQVFVDIKHDFDHSAGSVIKKKLYKWMMITNNFFDRDVLSPLTPTEKENAED